MSICGKCMALQGQPGFQLVAACIWVKSCAVLNSTWLTPISRHRAFGTNGVVLTGFHINGRMFSVGVWGKENLQCCSFLIYTYVLTHAELSSPSYGVVR